MKRKTGISLMIVLLMIVSTFSVVTASSSEPGIVAFEKTIWDKETQGWVDSLHGVIIGDTVSFKLTITYTEAGYYNGVKLSLKKINIFDNLPYGLEYVNGSSTVDGASIIPEINGNTLHWNLTDTIYNLDEGENHSIEFNALVVYSSNINYIIPETKIKNHAHATAWECGQYYYHDECDIARLYIKNNIEVKKEVWNGNEWVNSVDSVILGQTLTFKITITYYGPYVLDSMTVTDDLPYCLKYANKTVITGAENVIPTVGEGWITWYWAKDLNLGNGKTVTITFDTTVVEYCGNEEVNSVDVWAEAFCHPPAYEGHAEICVNCVPHDPIFEKTVWNGKIWDETANVYVNDTVRFKIELTYYGTSNLTDIRIVDKLPCVLIYANNEKVKIVHSTDHAIEYLEVNGTVSANKKTIWWNLTKELDDHDTLSIEFNAFVTGTTGDCAIYNTAIYTAHNNEKQYSGSDTAQIISTHKPPVPPVKLSISIKRFSLGRVQASIKNTGEIDASNIKWSIAVTGGVRKKINANADGTIGELAIGGTNSISTGKRSIKHGFGRITITVNANAGGESFELTAKGFVVGRVVIVR